MLLRSNFSSFLQYFPFVVRFSCIGRDRFSLRDKRLFEISEVEITRVNCSYIVLCCFASNPYYLCLLFSLANKSAVYLEKTI